MQDNLWEEASMLKQLIQLLVNQLVPKRAVNEGG